MTDDEQTPKQLPKIIWHEPVQPNGYFEVNVPISWKDFKSSADVKKVAVAIINIVGAIKTEFEMRGEPEIAVKTAEPERPKVKVKTIEPEEPKAEIDEAEQKRTAAIKRLIKEEPHAVAEKRKEYGEEVLSDEAAAAVIYSERSKPPEKPADIPKTAEQKTAAASDYTPPELADADYGETVRFYKSEFGWSFYLDKDKEEAIPIIFDWLISIPIEMRHRKKETKYPVISHNAKFIMCNSYEKDFITTALEDKGLSTKVKED